MFLQHSACVSFWRLEEPIESKAFTLSSIVYSEAFFRLIYPLSPIPYRCAPGSRAKGSSRLQGDIWSERLDYLYESTHDFKGGPLFHFTCQVGSDLHCPPGIDTGPFQPKPDLNFPPGFCAGISR